MRRAESPGARRTGHRTRGWLTIVAALAIALVALVALSGADTASAARAKHHPTHPSHSPTPSAPAFTLDFTCAQAWNQVLGVVCVKTAPGAALTISIRYCGHTANDASLKGTVHADDKGQYAWNWMPNTTCGTGKATVTAVSGGKKVKNSTSFPIDAQPSVPPVAPPSIPPAA